MSWLTNQRPVRLSANLLYLSPIEPLTDWLLASAGSGVALQQH